MSSHILFIKAKKYTYKPHFYYINLKWRVRECKLYRHVSIIASVAPGSILGWVGVLFP